MKKTKIGGLFALLSLIAIAPALSCNNSNMASKEAIVTETQDKCQEALNLIDLNVDTSNVVSDIILPVKGIYGAKFTWSTENDAIVSIKAVQADSASPISAYRAIVHHDSNSAKTANIIATAQIGSDTESVKSKSFSLTVSKATNDSSLELALKMEEDFSSYQTGVDISNYYKWQMSKGEKQITQVIEKESFPNINNLVSKKALEITSTKAATDTYYDRRINVNDTEAPNGAILEGYYLYTGSTNGISISLLSNGKAIASLSFSSEKYSYLASSSYSDSSKTTLEGVWIPFRISFRKSGYYSASIYSFTDKKYIDLTKESNTYFEGYGVSSGNKGNADTLRIVSKSGIREGKSYLSNLKLDSLENLPETEPSNPNRSEGIGKISNYEATILSYKGETITGIDPQKFLVANRFNQEKTYTYGTDYTISTVTKKTGLVTYYYHTFTLLSTSETKVVIQEVYEDEKANVADIYDFSVSYLKAIKTADNTPSTEATITLSGQVIRTDSVLYYAILEKGAARPTKEEIIQGTNLDKLSDKGSLALTTHDFSLVSNKLSLSKEYDVYAVTENTNGISDIYSEKEISTLINISTCNDFYLMATNIETKSSTFRLINNLDFSDYQWVPDITSQLEFSGVFDGQGYSISNLNISSPTAKVAIFYRCAGSIKNVTFINASVSGLEDVGIIAGNIYGGNYTNISFENCQVSQQQDCAGGAGYFGALCGRIRSSSNETVLSGISISGFKLSCPKYCGLLTGGVETGSTCSITGLYAAGKVDTSGAAIGLIGRNRGITSIDNGIVYLTIVNAKKEVGVVAGHNKEGGSLTINNFLGDLKIENITQSTYFNNFIGSNDFSTSTYKATNTYFIKEDYSNLGDSITPIATAITVGKSISLPYHAKSREFEENTFIRDFNTSLYFAYDEESFSPILKVRTIKDLSFKADDFISYADQIDTTKIFENHYFIYKASDVLAYLSNEEKAKIPSATLEKFNKAKKDYEDALGNLNGIGDDTDYGFEN
jgi:hypothetical protein